MKKFLVLLCFVLTSFQILAQEGGSSKSLPWSFSWSLKFDGIIKFVDSKVDYNPLFLYDDRMLNRDDVKLSFKMMPTDFYTADLYFFANLHLRNVRGEDSKGDLLVRIRPGVGLNNIFSFYDHLAATLGLEYRVDISDFKKYKHRLAFGASLEGEGAPGLSWLVEQKFLPRFTVAAKGLSEVEYETAVVVDYELLQHQKENKNPQVKLSLYNDFYFDATTFPGSTENEYYIEESLGLKCSWKKMLDFSFAPTYFFHNLDPYENVSLFGFKSALGASFSPERRTQKADGSPKDPIRYTLSAGYWGAYNFHNRSWDHLLQVSFGLSQTVRPVPGGLK